MSDNVLSDEQLAKIQQVVHDEALRASVAASFLPHYGPLPGSTESVPLNRLGIGSNASDGMATERFTVDDYNFMRLSTVSVNVYLKSQQVAEPELTSAQIMFRRAADVISRIQDAIVFSGQTGEGQGPVDGAGNVPPVYSVSGGGQYAGLLDSNPDGPVPVKKTPDNGLGEAVFQSVVDAILRLESVGHLGPFACVLGDELFRAITTPVPHSMVLPRDSILPFLNGPLLRTSAVPPCKGVVVSMLGDPAEIVMPSEISVKYLQTSMEPRHVYRVSQRFVLRVKGPLGMVSILWDGKS
jgi:hypothetical protein